jgi:hypothetical protein
VSCTFAAESFGHGHIKVFEEEAGIDLEARKPEKDVLKASFFLSVFFLGSWVSSSSSLNSQTEILGN